MWTAAAGDFWIDCHCAQGRRRGFLTLPDAACHRPPPSLRAVAGDPRDLYRHTSWAHYSPACHERALLKTVRELMLVDGELLLSDAGPAAGEARRQAHE